MVESQYNPFGLPDPNAEYIELFNATADRLLLDGCEITDDEDGVVELAGLRVDPGEFLLLARNDEMSLNGELVPDRVFGFGLDQNGATLTLSCGPGEPLPIDSTQYDGASAATYPDPNGASLQLDPSVFGAGATANDERGNWCVSWRRDYPDDPVDPNHNYGTPGEGNHPCGVELCRLDRPLNMTEIEGSDLTYYARWMQTDVSPSGNDPHFGVSAELGYGPDGADPTASDSSFTWSVATPNELYTPAVGEEAYDEYVAHRSGCSRSR